MCSPASAYTRAALQSNQQFALEDSEHPQDKQPMHSSSGSEPQSSQAQAGLQAHGEHPTAEREAVELSSKELNPRTIYMDEHVNGSASPRARAVKPAKDCPPGAESDTHDSAGGQPGTADFAAVENGKPDRHDDQASMQTAQNGGESDCHATHPKAEPPAINAFAKCQTSSTVRFLSNGVQDPQQVEEGAVAPGEPSNISEPAQGDLDAPDSTQAAEQPEPPPQNPTSVPGQQRLLPC